MPHSGLCWQGQVSCYWSGEKLTNSARIMLKAIKILKTIITFSEKDLGRRRFLAILILLHVRV